MSEQDYFPNHYLVAMPSLDDVNFSRAVIFLEEHSSEGAIGLIVNKPLHLNLGNVMDHLEIKITRPHIADQSVLMGGPVGQDQGFVLHRPWSKAATPTRNNPNSEICISSSKEILRQIATGQGPEGFVITLGYSGWEPGQLELEIFRNDWLVVPGKADILFDTPIEQRWRRSAQLLGIDITQLSDQSGHA